jgi:hypothetical protein
MKTVNIELLNFITIKLDEVLHQGKIIFIHYMILINKILS